MTQSCSIYLKWTGNIRPEGNTSILGGPGEEGWGGKRMGIVFHVTSNCFVVKIMQKLLNRSQVYMHFMLPQLLNDRLETYFVKLCNCITIASTLASHSIFPL